MDLSLLCPPPPKLSWCKLFATPQTHVLNFYKMNYYVTRHIVSKYLRTTKGVIINIDTQKIKKNNRTFQNTLKSSYLCMKILQKMIGKWYQLFTVLSKNQSDILEEGSVRLSGLFIKLTTAVQIFMKTVHIFHKKLSTSKESVFRSRFVPEFWTNLVQTKR